MNLTSFSVITRRSKQTILLAGLMTIPSFSIQASDISMTEKNGFYVLKVDQSTVKQVFDYIERNSKYVFVYDKQVKSLLGSKVSVETKGRSIEAILAYVCSQI